MRAAVWFLVFCLAWPVAAQTNPEANAPGAPILEPTTVTRYTDWTLRFPTAEKAEAHLREYKGIFGGEQATEAALEFDGKTESYRILSVEFKQVEGSKKYQYRARAKVEIKLLPYELNLAAARNKALAEAKGEAPITDELEAKMAQLEAEDEALSDAVVEAAVGDLMDKINDVEVMQNALIGVVLRLASKGPALGLWRGGLTADRYVSRLNEMVARVEAARQSVTGLQDYAWSKTSSIFGDFMRELDELETGGLNWDTYPTRYGRPDPDVQAFWQARDALHEAVKGAQKQTATYTNQMYTEQMQRTTRFFKREEKRKELHKEAVMARYARDGEPVAEDEAQDSAAATLQEDTAHLKQALQGKTPEEDLKEKITAPQDTEASEDGAAPVAPLRRAAVAEEPSPLRVAARAETVSARSMDADNPFGTRANQQRPETAPKVETPKTPFAKLRQDKRMAEERKARSASIQLTARAGADFRGIVEQFVAEEEANGRDAFLQVLYYEDDPAYDAAKACYKRRNAEWRVRDKQFRENCPRGRPPYEGPEYAAWKAQCPGDWYAEPGHSRAFPGSNTSGLRPYGTWFNAQSDEIMDALKLEMPCPKLWDRTVLSAGPALHIVIPRAVSGSFTSLATDWAKAQGYDVKSVNTGPRLEDLDKVGADRIGPALSLTGAPFELYETSALKEVRDMLEEQP